MKKKVTRLRTVKSLADRIAGIAVWRITGPDVTTNERVSIEFTGTRAEAEQVQLRKTK